MTLKERNYQGSRVTRKAAAKKRQTTRPAVAGRHFGSLFQIHDRYIYSASLVRLLDGGHEDVDHGDVVDGPGDELGLVEVGPGLPHVEAHLDAPQQEDQLTWWRLFFGSVGFFTR